MPVILASTSPRRKELLSLLNVSFEAVEPVCTEQVDDTIPPKEQAGIFAERKARSCAERFPGALVLGSDTLLDVEGKVVGKPVNAADARAMLGRLGGGRHEVHSAVALVRYADGLQDMACESVSVWMQELSRERLLAYLQSGEWEGKAGAYAIQGRGGDLIARIEGDFTAVVGLPLRLVAGLLQARGCHVPVDVERIYQRKPIHNWSRFSS